MPRARPRRVDTTRRGARRGRAEATRGGRVHAAGVGPPLAVGRTAQPGRSAGDAQGGRVEVQGSSETVEHERLPMRVGVVLGEDLEHEPALVGEQTVAVGVAAAGTNSGVPGPLVLPDDPLCSPEQGARARALIGAGPRCGVEPVRRGHPPGAARHPQPVSPAGLARCESPPRPRPRRGHRVRARAAPPRPDPPRCRRATSRGCRARWPSSAAQRRGDRGTPGARCARGWSRA